MYPHVHTARPPGQSMERMPARYRIRMRVRRTPQVLGRLERIVEHPGAQPEPHPRGSFTAPLAAYINTETGTVDAPPWQSAHDTQRAARLARAYQKDIEAIMNSTLGEAIREETKGLRPLKITGIGIEEVEHWWPGAIQTTTFRKDGTGFYTRDATNYDRKIRQMARLHNTDPRIMHLYATAHETTHGRGETNERQAHEKLYRALEKAIERAKTPAERKLYEALLKVETGELAMRYKVRKPRARKKRVLN